MAIEVGPALGLTADSSDLKTAIPVLDAVAKKAIQAEAAADKLAGGTKRMGAAMAAALASLKSIDGSLIKMASSQQKANQETDEAARKAQSAAAGYASLRASLDPLYAASKKYEAALMTLDAATEAGVISDRERMRTLQMLDAQFAATNNATMRMAGGVGHAGNVFAQFNDIGMMAFSGQSPLMLAIQQGTQLNQVWSQLGNSTASIGAVMKSAFGQLLNPIGLVTIGVIAGGAALVQWGMAAFGAEAKANTLEDALSNLNAVQSGLSASTDILTMSVVDLYDKYGLYAVSVRNAAAALAEGQVAEAQASLATALLESADALDRYAGATLAVGASGMEVQTTYLRNAAAVRAITMEMQVNEATAKALSLAFRDVQNAASFEDRVAALQRLDTTMKSAGVSAEKLPTELRKALIEAREAEIKTAELKRTMDLAASAASAIGRNVPQGGWLDGAISGAATLAATLWDAARARAAATSTLKIGASATTTGEGLIKDPSLVDMGQNTGGVGGINMKPTRGGGGKGGGGSGNGDLEALIDELRTEQETLDIWRAENLAKIAEYSEAELAAIGGRNEAKLRLEAEYQEKLKGILAAEQNYRLTETGNMFSALASIAAAGGKKTLRAQAVLSAAATMIAGYEAAMKAAAEAKTIPGRIAAYAQFVGMGLKAAATIRSAGGAGGGGGGGSSATAPATTAAAPARPQDVILDYSATADPAMRALAAALLGPMIDQLQKASKTGINIVAVRA